MVPRSRLTGRVSLEVGLTLNLRVVAVAAEVTMYDPISSAVRSIGGLTIDYNFCVVMVAIHDGRDQQVPNQIDMTGTQH